MFRSTALTVRKGGAFTEFRIRPSIHDGHRNRMYNKIKKTDGCDANDKELLEALLYNAFANGDVSDLARDLIEKFGTLQRVLQAEEKELLQVEGVGDSVIQAIRINRMCMRRALEQSVPIGEQMNNSLILREFCEGLFFFSRSEEVRILMLDGDYRYITQRKVCDGDVEAVKSDMFRIMKMVTELKADVVVIAHNHPKASVMPSDEDRITTREVFNMFERTGVYLADHIIIGIGGSLSMREKGTIPDIWPEKVEEENG